MYRMPERLYILYSALHYQGLNTVSLLVYSSQASGVCTVLCDGRLLMEDGKLLTLDEHEVYRRVDAAVKKLLNSE